MTKIKRSYASIIRDEVGSKLTANQLEVLAALSKKEDDYELKVEALNQANVALVDKEKHLVEIEKALLDKTNLLQRTESKLLEREKDLVNIKAQLVDREKIVAQIRAELEVERFESQQQLAAFKNQLEHYHQVESELKGLKEKVKTSYSTKDVSDYLSQVISTFNESTASDNQYAKYVINNMDVDLKVRVYGDDKNSLRFTAPNVTETTEESLSSIKISIQAIPN